MFKASTLSALALSLSALASPLAPRQESCADVSVFFARGTIELGFVGTIVGPYFRDALQSALGDRTLDFEGLVYPARVVGYLGGGDDGGATTMANNVTTKANACPDTKIVMSGYSQGAQVTHLAAKKLSSDIQNRVNAVVVFGDPDNGQAFPGPINAHVKTFCADGDLICDGLPIVLPPHFSYGDNAEEAASFVISQI